jgi:uncharacterized protein YhdP
VQGAVDLPGNDVALRDALPMFTRVTGKVEFTEKSLRIAGMNGSVGGSPVRADVGTRPDGSFEVALSGIASPQALRQFPAAKEAQGLLDRLQGSAHFAASLTLGKRHDVRVTSDLVGMAIDLPAPLHKNASEPLALRVEITSLDAAGDSVRVGAGSRLSVALDRSIDAEGHLHVERAAFAVGDRVAPVALPARGLQGSIATEQLNLDQWLPLLAPPLGDGAEVDLDRLTAQVRDLTIRGKALTNVQLDATRKPDGLWSAQVKSDQIVGTLGWQSERGERVSLLSARLTRLAVPEDSRRQVAELLDAPPADLPALDVTADDFVLAGRDFGRLEVRARNVGAGDSAVWEIQKLAITNPDGTMTATGAWKRLAGGKQREVQLDLALDFADAGRLLGRLGMPGVLQGGEGRLDGTLAWNGSPTALDYPSLGGELHLKTAKGRFLKTDPGAARLLGVVSLQALPHMLTLDFKDVFSEGFAFEDITATVSSEAGVLTSHDFKMRGVSASVLIDGSADLKQETQNLHVLVLPDVNAGSASLAYALLANPAIGLGTFVAQWMLREPLSKAFSREYDISGKWSDPQIRRRPSAPDAKTPPAPQ